MSSKANRLTFKDLPVGARFRSVNFARTTVWKKIDPVYFPPPAKHVHYNSVSADGSKQSKFGHSTVVVIVE